MIVEYIRYKVAAEKRDAFLAAYTRAGEEGLKPSLHCLAYELSECTEEAGAYILRIEWDSAEGHRQGFRTGPTFAPFFQAIGPYVGDIQEMRHYAVTSVVARKAA